MFADTEIQQALIGQFLPHTDDGAVILHRFQARPVHMDGEPTAMVPALTHTWEWCLHAERTIEFLLANDWHRPGMYWNTLAMPFDGTTRLRRGSPFGVAVREGHCNRLVHGDIRKPLDSTITWLYLLLDAPLGPPTLWVYRSVPEGDQHRWAVQTGWALDRLREVPREELVTLQR